MTKNNTVIERFRERFTKKDEMGLFGLWGTPNDLEAFLTEELAKEWQQGYEAGVLQTQGEIVEKIEGMKITQDELYVKMDKETKAYNQALKDIEQMIEGR